MSKQLGNSPDLLALIDQYGADAVRFGILIASPAGNDLMWDEASNEQGLHFNNKMWNALKLVKIWEGRRAPDQPDTPRFAVDWFEQRLQQARQQLDSLFAEFRLSEALKTLYSLIWDDFCSWYLEWVKPGYEQPIDESIYEKTVGFFEELMQLLHPFMPFITEEIYHQLRERSENEDLTISRYPQTKPVDEKLLQKAEFLKEVISGIRDARTRAQLKPKDTIKLFIQSADESQYAETGGILCRQVNASEWQFVNEAPANCINLVIQKDSFYLDTPVKQDSGAQKEELEKDRQYYLGFLASVDKKLNNEKFVQNAKPEVVENERKKRADALEKLKAIEAVLSSKL
jgi:valyl-tRNA synthetase